MRTRGLKGAFLVFTVTLRLDREVIEWFKSQGKGYQTRMNAVLKAYVKARRKRD